MTLLDPVAATGPLVAVVRQQFDRNFGCEQVEVRVVDLRDGRVARRGATPYGEGCDAAPVDGAPVVLTPAGGLAWVATVPAAAAPGGPRQRAVRALRGDGTIPELDRGTTIADLRLEGETARWTRDGTEQSAAL